MTTQHVGAATVLVVRARSTGRVHRPAGTIAGRATVLTSAHTWCGRTVDPVDVLAACDVQAGCTWCSVCWKTGR